MLSMFRLLHVARIKKDNNVCIVLTGSGKKWIIEETWTAWEEKGQKQQRAALQWK